MSRPACTAMLRMDKSTHDKLIELKATYNMSANAYLCSLILSEYDKLHGNPNLLAALDQLKAAEEHLADLSKSLGIPSPRSISTSSDRK